MSKKWAIQQPGVEAKGCMKKGTIKRKTGKNLTGWGRAYHWGTIVATATVVNKPMLQRALFCFIINVIAAVFHTGYHALFSKKVREWQPKMPEKIRSRKTSIVFYDRVTVHHWDIRDDCSLSNKCHQQLSDNRCYSPSYHKFLLFLEDLHIFEKRAVVA